MKLSKCVKLLVYGILMSCIVMTSVYASDYIQSPNGSTFLNILVKNKDAIVLAETDGDYLVQPSSVTKTIAICDINNDGKSELIFLTGTGDIYHPYALNIYNDSGKLMSMDRKVWGIDNYCLFLNGTNSLCILELQSGTDGTFDISCIEYALETSALKQLNKLTHRIKLSESSESFTYNDKTISQDEYRRIALSYINSMTKLIIDQGLKENGVWWQKEASGFMKNFDDLTDSMWASVFNADVMALTYKDAIKFLDSNVSTTNVSRPHSFAKALSEFFNDAADEKVAVLADLNNDNTQEMISIKTFPQDDTMRIGVFNENGNTVYYDNEFLHEIDDVYISDMNYTVVGIRGGDGYTHLVLEYLSEKINERFLSYSAVDANTFYYSFDQNQVTKAQYDDYCAKYGVYETKKMLYDDRGKNINDESNEILSMTTSSTSNDSTIKVFLNGKQIVFDQPPINDNGRVLVPIRAITETMGATVEWNGNTNTATIQKDGLYVTMQVDNKTITKNGNQIMLDIPPKNISGRVLVPVRALVEAFGAQVEWLNNSVYISI